MRLYWIYLEIKENLPFLQALKETQCKVLFGSLKISHSQAQEIQSTSLVEWGIKIPTTIYSVNQKNLYLYYKLKLPKVSVYDAINSSFKILLKFHYKDVRPYHLNKAEDCWVRIPFHFELVKLENTFIAYKISW